LNSKFWDKKQKVIKHYNNLAFVYDSLYGNEQKVKINIALNNLNLYKTDLVLDLGCGTCFLIEIIYNSIDLFVGVDISSELLKVAIKKLRYLRGKSNIFFVRADAEYLPFREETFDKIFAFTLLQNIININKCIRAIKRVAKIDSTIIVTGLKKTFSEKSFSKILKDANLDFSFIKNNISLDIIAMCRKLKQLEQVV
jgi:ubiquinone/menaquinone biosynthesis C-methylase UbiE